MRTSERILFWSTAALALLLRALAYFRYRFDSDEQQHLHVVWGWTAGLVQYRDYFDNHTPLFHLLMAPLLAALGERSDILLWMRAPMILLFAAVLACTWAAGRRIYDARTAAWACLLLALFPPFFLKSLEFRTDNLWNALWMAALLILLTRPRSSGWSLAAGFLLGCAVATSAKTFPLLIALAVAGALLWYARRRRPDAAPEFPVLHFATGLAVVPAAMAASFIAAGIWDEMIYCTLTFNGQLPRSPAAVWLRAATFPLSIIILVRLTRRFADRDPRRLFLALLFGAYAATAAAFLPLLSPRDFLPLMPPAAIFASAWIIARRTRVVWFTSILAIFLGALWYYADRFENRTAWHTTMLDQALRLTRPGELIIDYKGETIYRRRPFYYAFETITRAQIAKGLIRDTVAEDVVRTRTYVAQADGPIWPSAARAFLRAYFVDLGRLRAAGQWIHDRSFSIAVPGPYVVLDANGEARGTLDGTPYTGARWLEPGPHRFVAAEPGQQLCAVWAPAFRRGHSPFHLRDTKY